MSLNRRAAQRDVNEPEIIATFKAMGWLVVQHVRYDLQVQCPRANCDTQLSVEVKAPKGKLTPSQADLIANNWHLNIIRTPDEAVELVRAHCRGHHP